METDKQEIIDYYFNKYSPKLNEKLNECCNPEDIRKELTDDGNLTVYYKNKMIYKENIGYREMEKIFIKAILKQYHQLKK